MSSKKKSNKKSKLIKPPDNVKGILEGIIEAIGDDGSAQILGSDGLSIKLKGIISTQSATINAAIGRGGIPRGRLTIIHGPEGCGKTTLALHLAAETQRLGGVVIYIDKEYKLDPDYASRLGVDIGHMIISQPSYLEKAYKTFNAIIDWAVKIREEQNKRIPILIVLDSMNAAITKEEFDGDWEDRHYAPQAGVHSRLLPKLMPKISKEDIAMVWISQIRQKIGIQFGNPNDISGGKSPKFYSSLIVKMDRKKALIKDGVKIGNEVEVQCTKNQIAPPFRKAMCNIIFGIGIDKNGSILDQAVKDGIILQEGSWYSWRNEKLGHGRDASVKELLENEWMDALYEEIAEKNGWEK